MRSQLTFLLRAGKDEDEFQMYYAAVVRWAQESAPETARQLRMLSKPQPCGITIQGTDEPGRQLVATGLVTVPEHETHAVANAIQRAVALAVE